MSACLTLLTVPVACSAAAAPLAGSYSAPFATAVAAWERFGPQWRETAAAALEREVERLRFEKELAVGLVDYAVHMATRDDGRTLQEEVTLQLLMLGYLLSGPPTIEPAFDTNTGRSLIDGDVTVAVLCWTDKATVRAHPGLVERLETEVAYRLDERGGRLAAPTIVRDQVSRNDDADALALGRILRVDYVVEVELLEYTLFERGTRLLYRGRSEASVTVSDVRAGEKIFTTEVLTTYPVRTPRSTLETSLRDFRREHEGGLVERIGRLFHPYELSDDRAS